MFLLETKSCRRVLVVEIYVSRVYMLRDVYMVLLVERCGEECLDWQIVQHIYDSKITKTINSNKNLSLRAHSQGSSQQTKALTPYSQTHSLSLPIITQAQKRCKMPACIYIFYAYLMLVVVVLFFLFCP